MTKQMSKFPPSIVKEFILALRKNYTYNIRKNHYAIFGILWGIPVPLVTIGIGLYFTGLNPSLKNIISHITVYPLHPFFIFHPVMFGIVFGAMGTIREEKERQRLEFENNLMLINEELKRVNKKLQELDELKDNFLSMVSHELLTPLTTIQGYVTFLKECKPDCLSQRQIETLGIVAEETDHLKYLIEELMDLSKIKAGKFEVEFAPVNIVEVIEKVKNSFRPALENSKLALEDKITSGLPLALADANRMVQIFSNLLSNAIKFTPAGGRISISAQPIDKKLIFCIEDNGIGIAQEKIDRIFDRFYQADSSGKRRYGGCGLGLTITKSIIELHNGRIWVESKEGKGSKFFFELNKYSKNIEEKICLKNSVIS